MEYEVLLNGKAVGRVCSARQGLYERFDCQCRLPDRQVHRLYARCGAREECLGVLVPERGQFCLKTSIPAKRLGEGEREFWVAAGARRLPEQQKAAPEQPTEAPAAEPATFLPIRPGEPFAFIEELKRACLAVQDGQIGARLQADGMSSSNPTGQWSEPSTSL